MNAWRAASAAVLLMVPLRTWADDAAKPADTAPQGDPRAAALMAEAMKNRYMFGPEVTAVSGRYTYSKDGRTCEGTFRRVLRQKGGLSVTASDPSLREEAADHIASLIMHRTPAAPGARPQPPAPMAIVVEDEAAGPLLLVVGDPLHSSYRVKDGHLMQVNRHMGDRRFSINVTGFDKAPDGRFFTTAYSITWWDAATGKRLQRNTTTTAGLHVADGQVFPKAEKVVEEKDGATVVREIRYSDVKFEFADRK